MLRPTETTPLDLEASLLLDFYIRLRIAYKPLNRSWCLSLRSQLSGIVLRKHSLTNVELGTWGKPVVRLSKVVCGYSHTLIHAGGAVDRPLPKPPVLARAAMRFESRVSEYGPH